MFTGKKTFSFENMSNFFVHLYANKENHHDKLRIKEIVHAHNPNVFSPLHISVGVFITLEQFGHKEGVEEVAGPARGSGQGTERLVSLLQHVHVEVDHLVIQPGACM
jgi:hypothetical protein